MKTQAIQSVGIIVIVLSATCFSAPVLKNLLSEKSEFQSNNAKQINEQERELESLADSIQKSNSVGENVKIEEHHHVSYENINGKEKEVHETEKAVLDGDNGQVVSDIKQEVTKTEGVNGEPETHVETKIDVPSKGIHESFSNDGEEISETLSDNGEDMIDNEGLPNLGVDDTDIDESIITPESLAEYLWETQDFGKFRRALQDIVASRIMTPEEAQAFYQDVVVEYDKLRQLNSLYPFQSEDEQTFLSPLVQRPQYSNVIPGLPAAEVNIPFASLSGQKRIPVMPVYADEYPELRDYDLEQQRQAYEVNAAIQREETVDELLVSLLEQWFTSAIESGDIDGAKLVSDLASYVAAQPGSSGYDDEQVKEVLAEIFASLANGDNLENAQDLVGSLPSMGDVQSPNDLEEKVIETEEEKPVEESETEPESSGEEEPSTGLQAAKSA